MFCTVGVFFTLNLYNAVHECIITSLLYCATRLCVGFIVYIINFSGVLTKVPHVRSRQGWRKRDARHHNFLERLQIQDAIRAEIKDQNPKDTISGEKAFNPKNREHIRKLLVDGGCSIEKTCSNIFMQFNENLAKHVQLRPELEYQNFDPDTVDSMLKWVEDGQVLNRPT